MKPDALLWHNAGKKSLPVAVQEASAAHVRRLVCQPTNVILPVGDWPESVGGLKVETGKHVMSNYMQVYASPQGGLAGPDE